MLAKHLLQARCILVFGKWGHVVDERIEAEAQQRLCFDHFDGHHHKFKSEINGTCVTFCNALDDWPRYCQACYHSACDHKYTYRPVLGTNMTVKCT